MHGYGSNVAALTAINPPCKSQTKSLSCKTGGVAASGELDLVGVESLLESELRQAVEIIHRRDTMDALDSSVHLPSDTPPRSHSDDNLNSTHQIKLKSQSADASHLLLMSASIPTTPPKSATMETPCRPMNSSTTSTTDSLPHTSSLSHGPPSDLYQRPVGKSARLAAHRKSATHLAVKAVSHSFDSHDAHLNMAMSLQGDHPLLPLSMPSSDNSYNQRGSAKTISSSKSAPADLTPANRQSVTRTWDSEATPTRCPLPDIPEMETETRGIGMRPLSELRKEKISLSVKARDSTAYPQHYSSDSSSRSPETEMEPRGDRDVDGGGDGEGETHSDWVDVEGTGDAQHVRDREVIISSVGTEEDVDEEGNLVSLDNPTVVTKKVKSSAKTLLDKGAITEFEYNILLQGDAKYRELSAREECSVSTSRLNKCFGESWESLRKRVLRRGYDSGKGVEVGTGMERKTDTSAGSEEKGKDDNSTDSSLSRWPIRDLRAFIVKSNDDLRQEMCCMQLLELCSEIFNDVGLSNLLWLKTYRIISTGANTGVIQVLPDTLSIDAVKKTEDFVSLPKYYERMYGTSPERLKAARRNFVVSFAAYALVCHIFLIKDRHNGNILMDREGHVIHIDFGFMLGIAPGGSFSLETAPFKFTEEMVDILGGIDSPLFGELVRAFTTGFLALQANAENIVSTLEMLATDSPYPCFLGKDKTQIIEKLRGRFRTDLNVTETVHHCMDLITLSYGHLGTRQYDTFQWFTNGIIP